MAVKSDELAARYAVMLKRLRDGENTMRAAILTTENPEERTRMFRMHGEACSLASRHGEVLKLARLIENPALYADQETRGDWIVRKIRKPCR